MKFWKSLNNLIEETLPGWQDKFLSYKDLKKQLKLIFPKDGVDSRPSKRPRFSGAGGGGAAAGEEEVAVAVTKEVIDFVKLLEAEIEKFNAFFVDKEEGYMIRLEVLGDRVAEINGSSEELLKVGREAVDFHGEMVLLENYSALNYTGLVKILKKYDKLSGALIRLPFIQKVLQEPFFKTDVLKQLVKECETVLDRLFSMNERSAPSASSNGTKGCETRTETENRGRLNKLKVPEELSEIENLESSYVKLTLSALRVLKEIRSGSSTISAFSLPPMHSNELQEVWKKAPAVEQEAK
ncbi:hypothetical protein RJ639_013142 [Escallonia herrerae]|uniref:SPX domain-containing protein n=1 Tax=Escallonia herrerae TaxID=1293975 RepID=A0AA88VJF6_9ASTE|nr:hypothetical protein RJ639_013142 [Escallonia herrerae]